MQEFEKISFAQTAYKRLYWSGYMGRFGFFSWPTGWFNRDAHDYTQLGSATSIFGNNQNYDISEVVSRQVGRDLIARKELFAPADARHVVAHSMGNVVVSEALRHDTSSPPFFTSYTPSESAVVSGGIYQGQQPMVHTLWNPSEIGCDKDTQMNPEQAWRCYNIDSGGEYDMPPDLFRFNLVEDDNSTPVIRHGPTTDDAMNALVGQSTPYYHDLKSKLAAGRIVNLYNRVDSALNVWEFNQLTRPAPDYHYEPVPYLGDKVAARFIDEVGVRYLQWSDQITADSASILSRFIPARTNALGQAEIVSIPLGIASLDMGFTNSNQDHSAQFHGYYAETHPLRENFAPVRARYWNWILQNSVRLTPDEYSGLRSRLGLTQ